MSNDIVPLVCDASGMVTRSSLGRARLWLPFTSNIINLSRVALSRHRSHANIARTPIIKPQNSNTRARKRTHPTNQRGRNCRLDCDLRVSHNDICTNIKARKWNAYERDYVAATAMFPSKQTTKPNHWHNYVVAGVEYRVINGNMAFAHIQYALAGKKTARTSQQNQIVRILCLSRTIRPADIVTKVACQTSNSIKMQQRFDYRR